MERGTVLVVDDEPNIADLVELYLRRDGYRVIKAGNGEDGLRAVNDQRPRLVVLDVGLPDIDGLEVCRRLRAASNIPVIFLTARDTEVDRVLGLELGADDYVCKPFSPREVVARVKAILRRAELLARAHQEVEGAVPSPFSIDVPQHAARLDGKDLHLTPIEFRLLALLHSGAGRIYARDYLLRALYEDHRVVADRTIDSHVKNLRRKIQSIRPEQDMIRSIYGVGYRLEIAPASE